MVQENPRLDSLVSIGSVAISALQAPSDSGSSSVSERGVSNLLLTTVMWQTFPSGSKRKAVEPLKASIQVFMTLRTWSIFTSNCASSFSTLL